MALLANEEGSPATGSFSGMGGPYGRCLRDALLLLGDFCLHFGADRLLVAVRVARLRISVITCSQRSAAAAVCYALDVAGNDIVASGLVSLACIASASIVDRRDQPSLWVVIRPDSERLRDSLQPTPGIRSCLVDCKIQSFTTRSCQCAYSTIDAS